MLQPARLMLVLVACPLITPPIHAQTGLQNPVQVKEPTRLDWKFAVSGFGPNSDQVPADYDSKAQKYLLFVPKNYQPTKDWPLIVFISPGDTPAGWSNFQKVCEKHCILFCSPYG